MNSHETWTRVKRDRGESFEGSRAHEAARRRIELAERIYELRTAQKLSQTELGRRAGMSQAAIARLEAGAIEPKMETLGRLSEALGAKLVVRIEVGAAS